MMFIVTQLMTNKEKESMRSIFTSLDKNGDGCLTKEELMEGYIQFYGNKEKARAEVESLMANADADNNGKIDYSGNKQKFNIYQSLCLLQQTRSSCCQRQTLNRHLISLI
jgi:Ca2+-binding EF-hand superfamily protein